MRLNHLDLHVPDVAETTRFFTEFFGLTLIDRRGNGGLAILGDGHGLELVLSHAVAAFGSADQSDGPVRYHIGFVVDAREEVDRIHAALLAAGHEVQAPRQMRGGWLFYCTAPGNILVEVAARPLLA